MSLEGHDTITKESGSENVTFLSPSTGKRSREEALPIAEVNDLKAGEISEQVDQDGREEKAAAGAQVHSGKRSKSQNGGQHENVVEIPSDELKDALHSGAIKHNQFHCKVCSVFCTSEKDYNIHASGKKHARALMAILPQSSKAKESDAVSKTNLSTHLETEVSHEAMSVEQQTQANGSIMGTSGADGGKDVIMETQHCRDGSIEETVGVEGLKHDGISKSVVPDGHQISKETFTNGSISACPLANGTILDLGSCKHNSDCVAQALAIAFQVCACPGLEDSLKSGGDRQPMMSKFSGAAGALSSSTPGVVSMHAHCFKHFVREVHIKAIEDLFERLTREERARAFTSEAWLSSSAISSVVLPGKQDTSCSLCGVEYGSKLDLDLHVAGKKHTSMVKRLHLKCHLCNVNSNSEKDMEVHMSGKKHSLKLRLVKKGVAT